MNKSIGHIKYASIYTEFVSRKEPTLRGRPIIVVGSFHQRASIIAVSPEAEALGIRPGQLIDHIQSRHRDLKTILLDRAVFRQIKGSVSDILRNYSPLYELSSPTNSYIDLSPSAYYKESQRDILFKIWKDFKKEMQIAASSGLASNKLVSEVAARKAAVERTEIYEVTDGDERTFLKPHPINVLPVSDHKITERLFNLNYTLIGQIQETKPEYLIKLFGLPGKQIHQYSNGIDYRPIIPPNQQKKHFDKKIIFNEPTNNYFQIKSYVVNGLHSLFQSLRSSRLLADRMRLEVEYLDHQMVSRFIRFPHGMYLERVALMYIEPVLSSMLERRIQVYSIFLDITQISYQQNQLELWDLVDENREVKLMTALDKLEKKYGSSVVIFPDAGLRNGA